MVVDFGRSWDDPTYLHLLFVGTLTRTTEVSREGAHSKYADQCLKAVSVIGNFFTDEIDEVSRLPVIVAGAPSGSGYRTFLYYAQMTNSQRYALYDYGR